MTREVSLAAVDLGASSGRVILGRVGPDRLELTESHRFRNGPVRLPDGLYWDILGLYQDVITGLQMASRQAADLCGVAVDSWAVDYGLVAPDGRLLGNPRHYRDDRTTTSVPRVHEVIGRAELYAVNGLQFLPFNTLYQLASEQELGDRGTQALLIPDLLGYWLTGVRVSEQTNASTTGLLDATTGDWSPGLMRRLGLSADVFPAVVPPGELLAPLRPVVARDLGFNSPVQVSTVGSHDTASAVVGVPAQGPRFAYVSCGTWGLVGVELAAPVLTEASRVANFTNERGVDGTVRYLRNVMGLWVLSEALRSWDREGRRVELSDLLRRAAALPTGGPVIDVDDPRFLPPGDMSRRVADLCFETGQRAPVDPPATVRCILDSLASAFARAVHDAGDLSGTEIEVVHLVGGGSQNTLLCQLTADATGLPVVAGPVEATAMGNLVVQARTHGVLSGDLWALRETVRGASRVQTYRPQPTVLEVM